MLELFVYGIILGSIIALGALGVTIISRVANMSNFAHGDFMTVGAYVAFVVNGTLLSGLAALQQKIGPFSFGIGLLLSFIPAAIVTALLAIGIDQWVYRPLRGRRASPILMAMVSMGIAFAVRGVIYIIWGADFHFYFSGIRRMLFLPGGIKIRPDEILIMAVTWSLVALTYLFLGKTRTGKALRAVADNPDLARIAGIGTERMIVWAWGISGGLAAAAGILYGIETQLRPEMGWVFLLPLFAAVTLGGIGSMEGALVGGLVLGVAQQLSTAFLLPTYKPAVAFAIMVIILLVKPEGIFGRR
ncbi:MAG: branched-chain amino acid ABC transporter permease [Anaerolineales bacterium]|nr:MAG: branched-chain amino acid ABC transporter permease [Anaerolineales bacterium]